MADSMTQHRFHTARRTEVHRGPQAPKGAARGRTRGLVSFAAGALGIVAATLPIIGVIALVLAAVAIAAGVPVMRRGPGSPGFGRARVGVVLGMIAVLLGFVSLAMQLLT